MPVWKDIPSIPDYQVSSDGRVRRKERYSIYFAKGMGGSGDKISLIRRHQKAKELRVQSCFVYPSVSIKDRIRQVHKLVAQAFIPNPQHKPCINHKDGNKYNSCVENLEWCTYSENELHSHRVLGKKSKPMTAKTREKALQVRKANYRIRCEALLKEKEETCKKNTQLALQHGVSRRTIEQQLKDAKAFRKETQNE